MPPAPADRPCVEFFFDCGCPWSYLALGRLREAAIRTGAVIRFRPVMLDEVLAAVNPGFAQAPVDPVPARARYQAKDLQDWARFLGLRIRPPVPGAIDGEWAARGAVAAGELGRQVPYLSAVFEAAFDRGLSLADWTVILDAAIAAGLDGTEFEARARAPETLREVRRNGTELVSRGGFGTPTLLIGDDMYFGNDRMPLVEAALARRAGMRLTLPGEHG